MRVGIAGFGIVGMTVVVYRTEEDKHEFILVFRRWNLKPRISVVNWPP